MEESSTTHDQNSAFHEALELVDIMVSDSRNYLKILFSDRAKIYEDMEEGYLMLFTEFAADPDIKF